MRISGFVIAGREGGRELQQQGMRSFPGALHRKSVQNLELNPEPRRHEWPQNGCAGPAAANRKLQWSFRTQLA